MPVLIKDFCLSRLACKCSKAAKNAGYAGFAMHFYGECYGRSESQLSSLSSKGHEESKCVGDQTYTICDKEKHDHCTGGDFAEAIYVFKTSADKSKEIKDSNALGKGGKI